MPQPHKHFAGLPVGTTEDGVVTCDAVGWGSFCLLEHPDAVYELMCAGGVYQAREGAERLRSFLAWYHVHAFLLQIVEEPRGFR